MGTVLELTPCIFPIPAIVWKTWWEAEKDGWKEGNRGWSLVGSGMFKYLVRVELFTLISNTGTASDIVGFQLFIDAFGNTGPEIMGSCAGFEL